MWVLARGLWALVSIPKDLGKHLQLSYNGLHLQFFNLITHITLPLNVLSMKSAFNGILTSRLKHSNGPTDPKLYADPRHDVFI